MKTLYSLFAGVLSATAFSLNALAEEATPQFDNFAVVLNNESNSMLTAEEISEKASFSFGVAVADGVVTRVAADDPSSIATVSGKFHSDHGSENVVVVANVPGNVKVTLGTCTYGGHNASIAKGDETVATVVCASACWKGSHTSIAEMYYKGEAAAITINGASYTPYVAIEAIAEVPTTYNVSFAMSDEAVVGKLPVDKVLNAGETYNLPSGALLYKEGFSFEGWSDGEKQYKAGDELEINSDLALTPVFVANAAELFADRTVENIITWDFQTKNGAPVVAWEVNDDMAICAKATVLGAEIDVPIFVNTISGKFNNANNSDWCQVNVGTKITIPVCKGAKVSMVLYGSATGTTINGVDGNDVEIADDITTAEIVFGGDAQYIRSLTITIPAEEAEVNPTDVAEIKADGSYKVIKVEDFYLNGTLAPSNARGYLIERTTLKSETSGHTLIEQKPIVRK